MFSDCFVMINLLSAPLRDRTAEQGRGEAGDGEGLEEEEGQLDGDSWVTTTTTTGQHHRNNSCRIM